MCNNFIQRIRHAMNELLALKTAYQRGVGVFRFFRGSVTFNVPSSTQFQTKYWDIAVKIADGEPFPAYVQFEMQQTAGGESQIGYPETITTNVATRTVTYTFWDLSMGGFSYSVSAVSPSQIESVTATMRTG